MPVTKYIWDRVADTYLMETDEADNTTAVYTNEPVQYGNLVSQRRNGTTTYHRYDAPGSTRELTDSGQTVTDTNLYDAWGVNVASSGTTENPFGWIGQRGYYGDDSLESFYIRRRSYRPAVARWISMDRFARGLFTYVSLNPVNTADPSGLVEEDGDGEENVNLPGQYPAESKMIDCTAGQMLFLRYIVHRTLRLLKTTATRQRFGEAACFPAGRGRWGSADPVPLTPEEIRCRKELAECVVATLKSVTFRCDDSLADRGVARGECAKVKERARTNKCQRVVKNVDGKTVCTVDPSCGACDPSILAQSTIVLDDDVLYRKSADAARNTLRRTNLRTNRRLIGAYSTVVHEALHHCVGGHVFDRRGDPVRDKCGRPDVRFLQSQYGRLCLLSADMQRIIRQGDAIFNET